MTPQSVSSCQAPGVSCPCHPAGLHPHVPAGLGPVHGRTGEKTFSRSSDSMKARCLNCQKMIDDNFKGRETPVTRWLLLCSSYSVEPCVTWAGLCWTVSVVLTFFPFSLKAAQKKTSQVKMTSVEFSNFQIKSGCKLDPCRDTHQEIPWIQAIGLFTACFSFITLTDICNC